MGQTGRLPSPIGRRMSGSRPSKPGFLKEIFSAREGMILIAGVVVAGLYMGAILLVRIWSADLFSSLTSMTGTLIIGGRAAGMSWGYVHDLPAWVVILAAMTVETFLVLIFYSLFVLSYRHLIVIKPLESAMARAQNAAETRQGTIMKYGIPGLLLFVWFPFWMTGPVVGSVIGFLIGLRPWVNLPVVLSGTYLAIFCWSIILQRLAAVLERLGPYVPTVFVAIILLFAVSLHIRRAFSHRHNEGLGTDATLRSTRGEGDGELRPSEDE